MKKLLILSLGMAAFAGCASDASGPKREEDDSLKDRGSFCKAWANAACTDEVVQACQSTDKETCLVAQKAFCVELVPAGYVSTTAEKCIAAVKSAYSDEELTKEELDVVVNLGGACSQLVKGGIESGGTCRASTECDTTRGYSCVVKPGSSDGTCQIAKLQEPASKCTGLDQICQSGTYCDEGGHCVDTEPEHAACDYDAMCDASLRCVLEDPNDPTTGTCEKKLARSKECDPTKPEECISGICLEGANGVAKCADYVGLTFGSSYCVGLGGG